jgi:hypothetical protein
MVPGTEYTHCGLGAAPKALTLGLAFLSLLFVVLAMELTHVYPRHSRFGTSDADACFDLLGRALTLVHGAVGGRLDDSHRRALS